MVQSQIAIVNKLGLHARAAVKFVNVAKRYVSQVRVEKDGSEVDGKSILGILTLAATQGSTIMLKISGQDEKAALKALVGLIEAKFHEGE